MYMTGLELDGGDLNRGNFHLPTLGPKLLVLSRDVHHGKGFCVIRGIDPNRYAIEDLTLMYLGTQAYIADQRGRQDKRGNMLGSSCSSARCTSTSAVLISPVCSAYRC